MIHYRKLYKEVKTGFVTKGNELYSRQCEIMQSSTEDLQAFRHDMSNQLIILNHLLEVSEKMKRQKAVGSTFIS